MAKNKFYAVRSGREPGIYASWEQCKAQVDGYPNAEYKSFALRHEAEDWLGLPPRASAAKPAKSAKSAKRAKSAKAPRHREAAPEIEAPEEKSGLRQVTVYTDGACTGNPGPGGYGAVLMYNEHRRELSGGFRLTTNNRMEILACIVALRTLKDRCAVRLHSDSQYVVNAMTKGWARRWQLAGWKRREGYGADAVWKEAINPDLWEQMLALCDQHKVTFVWVRGHAGNVENERCDQLARQAILDGDLQIDEHYETKGRR